MVKKFIASSYPYLIAAALLYMPLFGFLGAIPIRLWDESRQALNAYEMLKNGNFLVTYYDGLPDLWNTKPPLLIWLQVGAMKIFGVNEFALRLPSALAALFTCMALYLFSKKIIANQWLGLFAAFVLITSQGYIHEHAARTGDYDALLTLFTTLGAFTFFAYCEVQKTKYLYLFFLFLVLGVLTKSVTGLLFLPALGLYALAQKQVLPLLKKKHFYLGIFAAITAIASYYLLREAYNPGYLQAVQENELGGRYLDVVEYHKHEFLYYFHNITNERFSAWYLLIPAGLLLGFFSKTKILQRLALFNLLLVVTFFLIISSSQTKLLWYDVPLYPFMALSVALFIFAVFDSLQNSAWFQEKLTVNLVPVLFLLHLGLSPYTAVVKKTYKPQQYQADQEHYELSYFLQAAAKGKYTVDETFLLYDGYPANILFYLHQLNDKGIRISLKDYKSLNPSDVVIAQQDVVKAYLTQHYQCTEKASKGNVVTYLIHERKPE